jgi:hypothetical protein
MAYNITSLCISVPSVIAAVKQKTMAYNITSLCISVFSVPFVVKQKTMVYNPISLYISVPSVISAVKQKTMAYNIISLCISVPSVISVVKRYFDCLLFNRRGHGEHRDTERDKVICHFIFYHINFYEYLFERWET